MKRPASTPQHSAELNRRELVQVGYSGALGLGLSSVLSAKTKTDGATFDKPPRAKSLIIVFLTGAASHHDTFDMKLEAPLEIRGEFQPIASAIPGVAVCEHLP